MTYMI